MENTNPAGNVEIFNDLRGSLAAIYSLQEKAIPGEELVQTFLRGMQQFFDAEGMVFLATSQTSTSEVTKTECDRGLDWRVTSRVQFEKGFLFQSMAQGKPLEVISPNSQSGYFPALDEVRGVNPRSLVSSPVFFGGRCLGVLGMVNPVKYAPGSESILLFQLFIMSFAGQLHSAMLLDSMKAVDTDLKVSRQQLINSRNTLRALFDNIPESFYLVDKDYTLRAVNLSRAKRVDSPPAPLVGKPCYTVLFGSQTPCLECLVLDTLQTGKDQHKVNHRWTSEKAQRYWDLSSYPVRGSTGEVEQVILLEQDVTERRRIVSTLIENEKLESVGKLAGSVAHEINNPLTAILANAQLLSLDLDPGKEEQQESLRLIELAAKRAHKVVENLQGLVQQEKLSLEKIDLNESIQSALSLVSHEFIPHQISMRFNRDVEMPPLFGSNDHLQGVWINLLLNAIESIGEKPGEITIESLFEEGNFYLEIKDTGIGISEQNLDKIFDPFFTTKKTKRGRGFGLALAQRVIHAHGGQIHVESIPGEGTRFTVILPELKTGDTRHLTNTDMQLE